MQRVTYRVKRPSRIVNDAMRPLARCVARFCDTLVRLPEHNVSPAHPFHRTDIAQLHGRAVQVCEHLTQFGNAIGYGRGGSVTTLQRALHQLQWVYRSLQGLMVGVPDRLLDWGDSAPHGSIRHLLLSSFNFYQRHAPVDEPGVLEEPKARGLWAVPSALPPVSVDSGRTATDSLSVLCERNERLHRSMIEGLLAIPEEPATSPNSLRIEEQLCHLESHLLERHIDLLELLQSAGHCRTEPMHLAHEVFMALGHVEGSMMGAEARFEKACQPMIDLITARTNELSRYC